jgi:hypothetical protein
MRFTNKEKVVLIKQLSYVVDHAENMSEEDKSVNPGLIKDYENAKSAMNKVLENNPKDDVVQEVVNDISKQIKVVLKKEKLEKIDYDFVTDSRKKIIELLSIESR